jgi:DNA polymerase
MSLHLDTRQRAMLQEMGVQVWLPAKPIELKSTPIATQNIASRAYLTRATGSNHSMVSTLTAVDSTPKQFSAQSPALPNEVAPGEHFSVLTRAPQAVNALTAGLAPMTWPELQQAVAACQACAMCQGRRAPVLAAPEEALPCDWMVVGEPPDELQERLGQPFAGESGQLLDKMLRAVGAQRFPSTTAALGAPGAEAQSSAAGRAYLTNVLKCRPARVRAPVASELAACAAYLRREIALVQPKVIVTMGRFAMQVLLSEMPPEQVKLPLGKLRGRVWQFAGVPVVVTYPPDYLLGNPQEKAKAWADLQLAMAVVRGQTGVIQSDVGL